MEESRVKRASASGEEPEFKREAVRRQQERRWARISLAQITRELAERLDMLGRQERALGAAPAASCGASGCEHAEEEERRLRRRPETVRTGREFLKGFFTEYPERPPGARGRGRLRRGHIGHALNDRDLVVDPVEDARVPLEAVADHNVRAEALQGVGDGDERGHTAVGCAMLRLRPETEGGLGVGEPPALLAIVL